MKKERVHSFEISNLSLINIIGLSLLLTSSYYFVEFSTFISVDFATQFVELSFLFIFSVIFFLLLVIFFKLLEKKLPLAFSSFLTYIFFTWVLVQSIQTFFYLSNYITLSYFISKSFFLYAMQFLLIGHSPHKGLVGLQIKAPISIIACA